MKLQSRANETPHRPQALKQLADGSGPPLSEKNPLLGKSKFRARSALAMKAGGSNLHGPRNRPKKPIFGSEATNYEGWRKGEWCPEPGSNQRHCDFQSHALPTELSGLVRITVKTVQTAHPIGGRFLAVHPCGMPMSLKYGARG
jgi:hypothetical protein